MGTRGIWGFRKNGIDKTTYNHWDSYPKNLGERVLNFTHDNRLEELNRICDGLIMVDPEAVPTKDELEKFLGEKQKKELKATWYDLTRGIQNDPQAYETVKFMADSYDFIKDSLFCEYGYIINLDSNKFEFWVGFQKEPDDNNRYGTERDGNYYPCKKIFEIPIKTVNEADEEMIRDIVGTMSVLDLMREL